jgi:hypothetical protein
MLLSLFLISNFVFTFSLDGKSNKRSRANDIHHVRSFALIELCADDFSAVEP